MTFMLDTNIVSDVIKNPGGAAGQRVRAVAADVLVSVVVAGELRYGGAKKGAAALIQRIEAFLLAVPVVPLGPPADRHYGAIRAALELAGLPIGQNDLLIAAHARALDATLVTANVREFERVPGLAVENWLV